MRRLKLLLVIALLIILFTLTPTFQWLKSIAVMSVYSTYESYHSVLNEERIRIRIPGGMTTGERDWYPFVITFNDDRGFSKYTDRDLRMTVLYNFGYFPWWRSWSAYYDVDSPYYNSFYGAYAVKVADGEPFGFPQGNPDIHEMGLVPEFDMKWLVLSSIGQKAPVFSYKVTAFEEVTLLGEQGWQVFDADMRVSGSMHAYEQDYRAYIQYGRPPVVHEDFEDYEVIDMNGRIYGKYYEEQEISIFFYCIASSSDVIEDWEKNIMSESEVIFK